MATPARPGCSLDKLLCTAGARPIAIAGFIFDNGCDLVHLRIEIVEPAYHKRLCGSRQFGRTEIVLAVMGVLTKLVGGIAGAWKLGKWNSVVVGVGMSPRGEVGIVVAALGLSLALISREVYAVLLAAVILTTLVAPVMLQWAIPRAPRDERHHGNEAGAGAA